MEWPFQWNWVSTKMVELAFHPQSNGKAIPIPFNIFIVENTPLLTIGKQIEILRKNFEGGEKKSMKELSNLIESRRISCRRRRKKWRKKIKTFVESPVKEEQTLDQFKIGQQVWSDGYAKRSAAHGGREEERMSRR